MDETRVMRSSFGSVKDFTSNPEYFHYIGMIVPRRVGLMICLTELECNHYASGSSNSGNIIFHYMTWNGFHWVMTTIHGKDSVFMEKAARENGLKVVKGPPSVMRDKEIFLFPLSGDNIFTLVGASEKTPDKKSYLELIAEEDRKIREFVEIQEAIKNGQVH